MRGRVRLGLGLVFGQAPGSIRIPVEASSERFLHFHPRRHRAVARDDSNLLR